MTEMADLCGCQPALWITGENPVDKPSENANPATPLTFKTNYSLGSSNSSLSDREREDLITETADIVRALLESFDELFARVQALEARSMQPRYADGMPRPRTPDPALPNEAGRLP